MTTQTQEVSETTTCDLSKDALIRSMVRKLRGFNPDGDEDTVLGAILNDQEGGGKFVSSATIWRSLVLKAVWKRDERRPQGCTDQIYKRWPEEWLNMTSRELAGELLPEKHLA